jgi:hypothetical protein
VRVDSGRSGCCADDSTRRRQDASHARSQGPYPSNSKSGALIEPSLADDDTLLLSPLGLLPEPSSINTLRFLATPSFPIISFHPIPSSHDSKDRGCCCSFLGRRSSDDVDQSRGSGLLGRLRGGAGRAAGPVDVNILPSAILVLMLKMRAIIRCELRRTQGRGVTRGSIEKVSSLDPLLLDPSFRGLFSDRLALLHSQRQARL